MKISTPLLAWYHQNRRVLPFREDPTPYHVWVSEIMLQQTQVTAALPYYHRFIETLPSVADLAACPEEQLLKLWEGLGYYSRVRNLQKAACVVMEQFAGEIPGDYDALLKLPGIGSYTAGAIASIAFGQASVAVDGNVLRVFSRLLACTDDIATPAAKNHLSAEVQQQLPKKTPGDFNQALMELGALVCRPGMPNCGACPLQPQCAAFKAGIQDTLPRRSPKPEKPILPLTGLVLLCGNNVLLQQRPARGLLARLWQPLLFDGHLNEQDAENALALLVDGGIIQRPLPPVRHVFTHKIWQLEGWVCTVPAGADPLLDDYVFATPTQLNNQYALPGAFKAWLPFMKIPAQN